jgi:hypothetical protein
MSGVEDVAEASIQLLARYHRPLSLDVHLTIITLQEFQEMCDAIFANFRVIDLLLKAHNSYRIPLDEGPDYGLSRYCFDHLEDWTSIHRDPTQPWDVDDNSVGAYFQDGYVFTEGGSPLWERLVELGVLAGEDAEGPGDLALSRVVSQVVANAEDLGDRETLRM